MNPPTKCDDVAVWMKCDVTLTVAEVERRGPGYGEPTATVARTTATRVMARYLGIRKGRTPMMVSLLVTPEAGHC